MRLIINHSLAPLWFILSGFALVLMFFWPVSSVLGIVVAFLLSVCTLLLIGISQIVVTTQPISVVQPIPFLLILGLVGIAGAASLIEVFGRAQWYLPFALLLALMLMGGTLRTVQIRRWKWLSFQAVLVLAFFVGPWVAAAHTPKYLHRTVALGDDAHARILLLLGADPNSRPHNNSLLNRALDDGVVRSGTDPEMIDLLLAFGADANAARNNFGWTALQEAVFLEEFEIAYDLLRAGAQPAVDGDGGIFVLRYASRDGNIAFLKTVLAYDDVQVNALTSNFETSALYYAKNPETAAFLLDNGADIRQRTAKGETLLHWHAERANLTMLQYFANQGLSYESTDMDGNIPLISAVSELEDADDCINADRVMVIRTLAEMTPQNHPAHRQAYAIAKQARCTNLLNWLE